MNTQLKHDFRALETGMKRRFKDVFEPIPKTYVATVLTLFLAT
jgi:hypothetical protein